MSSLWKGSIVFSLLVGLLVHRAYVAYKPTNTEHQPWGNSSTDTLVVEDFPANLIFDSFNSLLQHWPNRRFRNGHTIVPATIPVGTLLYHGSFRNIVPPGPEWVAVDPEHAFMFCAGDADVGCWQLTLATSRPLKLLYFDGSSGAKMRGGPLDSQDVLLWGGPVKNTVDLEAQRICELCAWGKPLGLDGFVRMEMAFEVMLCDFTDGLDVISFDNIVTSGFPAPEVPPHPNPCEAAPFQVPEPDTDYQQEAVDSGDDIGPDEYSVNMRAGRNEFSTIEAGTWHSYYPGDSRIQLDLTRAISFYDPYLFPALASLRRGKERWRHRLAGINYTEAHGFQTELARLLTSKEKGSGVDWRALFNVIVDRYAGRLELMRHLLSSGGDSTQVGKYVHSQLRTMVSPYRLQYLKPSEIGSHAWTSAVVQRCATAHTSYISSLHSLTPPEKVLLRSVQEVNAEICRVVVQMWAEGMDHGLGLDPPRISVPEDISETLVVPEYVVQKWRKEVEGLMEWLDWSVWAKCNPACGPEEMCYFPTWPFLGARAEQPMTEREWKRHHPRCINRLPPYNGLKMW